MNKIHSSLILLVLITLNTGCQNATEKNTKTLVGKWMPVGVEGSNITESDKVEILSGGNLEFSKDGQFTIRSTREGETKVGVYNYNESTHALDLQSGDDEKHYSVQWISADSLKLIVPEENIRIVFRKAGVNSEITAEDEVAMLGLAGIWKPVAVDGDDISEEEKQELLNGTTVEFTAGGNYIATSPNNTEYGKYLKTGSSLKLESEGKIQIFTLEQLSNDRIILKDDRGRVTLERRF